MTEFNPSTPLAVPDSPSPARSMHLLAVVVDGSKFASYPQELIAKMKSAIDCAKHPTRKIPRVVLVTHADKVILCNVKIMSIYHGFSKRRPGCVMSCGKKTVG